MLAVLITSARRKVTKLCYEKVFSFIIKLQCYRLKLLNWCQKKLVLRNGKTRLSFDEHTAGFGCVHQSPSKTYCD